MEGYESELENCTYATLKENPLVVDLEIGSGVSVWWPDEEVLSSHVLQYALFYSLIVAHFDQLKCFGKELSS